MESKIKSMIVAEKKENGNGCATKSFESIHTNWHRIGRKCYDEDLEVRHWGFWFLLSFESPPISLLTDCLLAPDCQDFSSDLFYTELTSALSTQGDQPTQAWESGSCPKDCWLATLGASSNFLFGRQVQLYLYHIVSVASKYLKLIEYINLDFLTGPGDKL